jgi:HEAT repeat protein
MHSVLLMTLAATFTVAAMPFQGRQGTSPGQAITPQARANALTTARRAVTGGQPALALRTLEPLLASAPGDREVVDLAIGAALSQDDTARANGLYDRFVQATNSENPAVLRPIAIKELQRVVANAKDEPRLAAEALERLVRGGDSGAAADLRQPAGSRRVALLNDTVLMRTGDQAAATRVTEALNAPDLPDKTVVAEAIGRSGDVKLAPNLVPLLRSNDPYTRIAAVEGLASLGYKDALSQMRALTSDQILEVRTRAGMALTRLGDPAGRQMVDAMMRSPVPDVRLRAVQADTALTPAERRLVIAPILVDPDPLNRVFAAELLAIDDPEAAKPILLALLKDPDMTPRKAAGRVIETLSPPDIPLYRDMMASLDLWVRMYGAGGILKAVQAPPRVIQR